MDTNLANIVDEPAEALLATAVLAEQDEAALVVAAGHGSHQAFELLLRRHQAAILRVAWRFSRNREDAEDIAQQTFHKAFVHLQQFQGNASFSTWLTRIAMNEGLMWLRRKRSSSEVPLDNPSQKSQTIFVWDPPDPGLDPEETFLQLERKRILSAAINKLSPKVRTAVRMRELSELSVSETAESMGLSVGTIKARLFHGRGKLRTILKRRLGSASRYGEQALRSSRRAPNQLACAACD